MAKRALVIGSKVKPLKGVERDAARMQAMLAARGFDVDVRIGERATRDGILAGYDQLIAKTEPGDAAVVYYSGHGYYASVPAQQSRTWQAIVPTDLAASTAEDWRGITAWELSIKQAQLTAKTENVTVILDACHSAQMSRDGAVRNAIPRALPHPILAGFDHHLAALKVKYGEAFDAVDPVGNRLAVRLVACGQVESAFEYGEAEDTYRGAFTEALLAILEQIGSAEISWAALAEAVRARVLALFVTQCPSVEGPASRRLFSLVEDDDQGHVAIAALDGRLRLAAGTLTGVALGDVYGVMPVGSPTFDAARALGTVEVDEVLATTAFATPRSGAPSFPVDAVAIPITRNAVKRVVALDVPVAARAAVVQAIDDARTLRVAGPADRASVATLRLVGDALTIEDERGPLFPLAQFPDELTGTVKNLANLGVAQSVRALEGEHGLPASALDIEFGVVEQGQLKPLPCHGAALGLRDRIYVKVTSKAQQPLYIHVFGVGVRGTVTLLTSQWPTGFSIDHAAPTFLLGKAATEVVSGLKLFWPTGLPRDSFPRIDEFVVIATTEPASLRGLATTPFLAVARGAGSKLEDLLAQLQDGLSRDSRADEPDAYFVKRVSWLLHPREAAMAGLAFEIDENPLSAARDPGAWLARGEAPAPAPAPVPVDDAPGAIAIRITDLVVDKNRALFSADIRVDALVCTRSEDPAGGRATWTQRWQNIRNGERLALEHGVIYLGPVRDFVDITLFVSRDTDGSLELARLFETRAMSPEFKDAATALLFTAGAVAAPWVAAVGASAVLARMAYELVLGVAGKSIGLYRTSFLKREHFGVGRHPDTSLYRAQDFSFSLAIEPV